MDFDKTEHCFILGFFVCHIAQECYEQCCYYFYFEIKFIFISVLVIQKNCEDNTKIPI